MIPLSSILTSAENYLGRAGGFPPPLNSVGVVIAQHIARKKSAEITLNHTIIPSPLAPSLAVMEGGISFSTGSSATVKFSAWRLWTSVKINKFPASGLVTVLAAIWLSQGRREKTWQRFETLFTLKFSISFSHGLKWLCLFPLPLSINFFPFPHAHCPKQ